MFFFFYFFRINTEIVSEAESDDFTDEEEEQRKKELEEQLQHSTPTIPRRSSTSDNNLNRSPNCKSNNASSQWYMDMPKNTYLEALTPPSQNGN